MRMLILDSAAANCCSPLFHCSEDQDEETAEWEQEQLRRGGLRAEETADKPVKQVYKPAPSTFRLGSSVPQTDSSAVPAMTPIPTLGPAIARLTAAMTALTTSHAQNTAAMVSLADERAQLEVREKEMRDMIVKTEDKSGSLHF